MLPDAYKLMYFDRNINGNKDEKILEDDYFFVSETLQIHGKQPQIFLVVSIP